MRRRSFRKYGKDVENKKSALISFYKSLGKDISDYDVELEYDEYYTEFKVFDERLAVFTEQEIKDYISGLIDDLEKDEEEFASYWDNLLRDTFEEDIMSGKAFNLFDDYCVFERYDYEATEAAYSYLKIYDITDALLDVMYQNDDVLNKVLNYLNEHGIKISKEDYDDKEDLLNAIDDAIGQLSFGQFYDLVIWDVKLHEVNEEFGERIDELIDEYFDNDFEWDNLHVSDYWDCLVYSALKAYYISDISDENFFVNEVAPLIKFSVTERVDIIDEEYCAIYEYNGDKYYIIPED